MKRVMRGELSALALGGLLVAGAGPAMAQQGSVAAGVLTCDVASGWGFVFGSSRDLKCTFASGSTSEHYTGTITKFGVDIGYSAASVIVWTVLAPSTDVGQGTLAGTYSGAAARAAVGVGGGANVLVGGGSNSFSLQPISISAGTGLNVAGGIASINLQPAS